MSKELTIFDHPELGTVRTTTDEATGEPLFVASDVARVLGYANGPKAVRDHCRSPSTITKRYGGFITLIPERDVYRLIIRSKLPAAEAFEEWVVGTVLPSIRKHGGYIMGQEKARDPKDILADALKLADSIIEERERKIEQQAGEIKVQAAIIYDLAPKAAIVDQTFANDDDAIPLQNFARTIPYLNQMKLKADLKRLAYFYQRAGSGVYRRYARYATYFHEKYNAHTHQHNICVTKEGQKLIMGLFEAGKLTREFFDEKM